MKAVRAEDQKDHGQSGHYGTGETAPTWGSLGKESDGSIKTRGIKGMPGGSLEHKADSFF